MGYSEFFNNHRYKYQNTQKHWSVFLTDENSL